MLKLHALRKVRPARARMRRTTLFLDKPRRVHKSVARAAEADPAGVSFYRSSYSLWRLSSFKARLLPVFSPL